MLAGVSVSYYRSMEQGLSRNASDQVIDALARALRLDEQEHEHLRLLARPGAGARPRRRRSASEPVDPRSQLLVESVTGPALIIGPTGDVLAWNTLGHALLAGHVDPEGPYRRHDRPNLARLIVLDPHGRDLYVDWPAKVRGVAAHLRYNAARHPDDDRIAAIIGELMVNSKEFARIWAGYGVRPCGVDDLELAHPLVGRLSLVQHLLVSPTDPDRVLHVYVAEPDSPSDAALRLLAGLTAGEAPSSAPERASTTQRASTT